MRLLERIILCNMAFFRRFKGKIVRSADKYYGLVYDDIVETEKLDARKIKSDADLRKFMTAKDTKGKIGDKLLNKLVKTSVHQEQINQNLEREGKFRLKSGKIVDVQKRRIQGREVMVFESTIIVAKKSRTIHRNARTGRFIRVQW